MNRQLRRFVATTLLILCSCGLLAAQKGKSSSSKSVPVKGYTTKSGKTVEPYTRSAPKSSGSSTSSKGSSTTASTPAPSVPAAATSSSAVARDKDGKIARSEAAKAAFMRQTGYPNGRPGYVVDHITPLACGGADTPANMQWQTVAAAKAKDKVEATNCGDKVIEYSLGLRD